MSSVITTPVAMAGAAGSRDVETPKTMPKYGWVNVNNMTDNTLYLARPGDVSKDTAAWIFGPFTTRSVPLTPETLEGFRVFWTTTGNAALLKFAQFVFTQDSLGWDHDYTPSMTYANGGIGMNVQNTATVQGTVNINSAPVIDVKNEAGGSLTVAGTVAINNTPSVSISGTPSVAIAANQSVNIGNTINAAITSGSVNATIQNASLNSNVTNALLNTNPTVTSTPQTNTINLAINATTGIYCLGYPLSVYDSVYFKIKSKYHPATSYAITLIGIQLNAAGGAGAYVSYPLVFSTVGFDGTYYYGITNPIAFSPMLTDIMSIQLKALVTITNDIITNTGYLKYASDVIINPVSNPASMQAATGSYDTPNYVNTVLGTGYTTILTAGNYVTKIRLSVENFSNAGSISFVIYNGTNLIYQERNLNFNTSVQIDITFPNGQYNNGIKMYTSAAAPQWDVVGFINTSSQTASQRVSTIVVGGIFMIIPQGEIIFEEWHLHRANNPSSPLIYTDYNLALQDMQQLINANPFIPCYLEKNVISKKIMGVFHTAADIPVVQVTNNFANAGQSGIYRVATLIQS